jgi:DNA-binding LacI/PurR family transcriptional regulator
MVLSLWDNASHCFKISFTAAICFGDNFALGVYKAASQLGLSIPDDISVVGFDDNDICEFATPPLTSVHLPRERMVKSCIDILESKLNLGAVGNNTISLSPHLVVRKSVKPIY